MRINDLQSLIGRKIIGIISVQGRQSGPRDQLFLLLDDNTYHEIYGSDLGWSGRAHPGDRDAILGTLSLDGGEVREIGGTNRSEE